MPWMVLMTPEPLSLKLVLLNVAIPLVEPSALALSMVMVPLPPVELAKLSTPVWLSKLVTPPPAPPVQAAKVNTPAPDDSRQSPLLPPVVGSVRLKLEPDAPDFRVTALPLVLLLKTIAPLLPLAVPSVKALAPWITTVPEAVTTVPDSLRVELVMEPLPLNLAMLPLEPDPVMPPPEPPQLPKVTKQTVSLTPAVFGIVSVELPTVCAADWIVTPLALPELLKTKPPVTLLVRPKVSWAPVELNDELTLPLLSVNWNKSVEL